MENVYIQERKTNMKQALIEKYAYLLVRVGLDVQPGQKVIIECPVEAHEFARLVTKVAYQEKAGEVIVHYTDAVLNKVNALNRSIEDTARVEKWQQESLSHYLEQGACSLLLRSNNPHLMDDLDGDRAHAIQTHINDKRNIIRAKIASAGIQWCIATVPTLAWAKTVMPEVSDEQAVDKMWELLLKLCYIDEENDPVEVWKNKRIEKGLLQEKLTNLNYPCIIKIGNEKPQTWLP